MACNEIIRDKEDIAWRQIVRNKSDEELTERTVPVRDDVVGLVQDYAEFCVESGGDRYSSLGAAMDEINGQSKKLLDKVYSAEKVEEVESYGSMLNAAIILFKALETYYFSEFGLRTGTGGD
jgi:hypothetical protein